MLINNNTMWLNLLIAMLLFSSKWSIESIHIDNICSPLNHIESELIIVLSAKIDLCDNIKVTTLTVPRISLTEAGQIFLMSVSSVFLHQISAIVYEFSLGFNPPDLYSANFFNHFIELKKTKLIFNIPISFWKIIGFNH